MNDLCSIHVDGNDYVLYQTQTINDLKKLISAENSIDTNKLVLKVIGTDTSIDNDQLIAQVSNNDCELYLSLSINEEDVVRNTHTASTTSTTSTSITTTSNSNQINDNREMAETYYPELSFSGDMLFLKMFINGNEANALIDTGAQVTIVTEEAAKRLGIEHLSKFYTNILTTL